jgi:adenosylhomocysteine nucleosidase
MSRPAAAVVIAMEVELRHLLDQGHVLVDQRIGPWHTVIVEIGGREAVCVRASIGMVNAAAATEFVIGRFAPPVVLNSGCVGAHRPDLFPGDVVIGTGSAPHGVLKVHADGADEPMEVEWHTEAGRASTRAFTSDPGLVALAHKVDAGLLPWWPDRFAWPEGQPRRAPRIVDGVVASADVWTQDLERMDLIVSRHSTACEDMEAAAIAQICARHGVPFMPVKDISNNERHAQTDLSGGWATFPMDEVGLRSAIVLAGVIAQLPPS